MKGTLLDLEEVNKRLQEAKDSLNFCYFHNTGMDDYRGELRGRIKIYSELKELLKSSQEP